MPETLVRSGGVVPVQRDDEGDAELLLQRKSGRRIDGEMRVQQHRVPAPEETDKLWSDAGGEEQATLDLVGGFIAAGEKGRVAGVDEEGGGYGAEAGEAGSIAA